MSIAVIYTRVSTAEQTETESLNQQERFCRDFAAKRDLEVDRVFVEAGESAKTASRTQLLNMLNYCKTSKGRIKYVIVWKVDRFARRAEDHLTLRAILMKLGIQLISATEPIENTNTGKLMETILAGFAEFDNGIRSERSAGGMKSRLEQGGWVHMAPIGYRNVRDADKRPTLEPDDMAPTVRAFLLEFKKGIYTQKQGVKLAHDMGVRTKKGHPVSANGIYKMLRNPVYAGLVKSKMLDQPVKGLHQGLISVEDFESIGGTLSGRSRGIKPEARGKPLWPLRRFLRCGRCDHPLTGSSSKGRNSSYPYYHCVDCKGSARTSREEVHTEFEVLLERVKPSRDLLALFKAIVLRRWNEEFREVQEDRRELDKQITDCENKRNMLFEKHLAGVYDDEMFKDQIDRIGILKTELKLKRAELYEGELEKEAIVDYAINFMANAASLWKEAELADRQRFQKMLYPSGIPYKFADGFGTAEMGACYEEIKLVEAQKQKEAALNGASSANDNTLVVPRGFEPLLPA